MIGQISARTSFDPALNQLQNSFEPASNQLQTSFELSSVMVFHINCIVLRVSHATEYSHSVMLLIAAREPVSSCIWKQRLLWGVHTRRQSSR